HEATSIPRPVKPINAVAPSAVITAVTPRRSPEKHRNIARIEASRGAIFDLIRRTFDTSTLRGPILVLLSTGAPDIWPADSLTNRLRDRRSRRQTYRDHPPIKGIVIATS